MLVEILRISHYYLLKYSLPFLILQMKEVTHEE